MSDELLPPVSLRRRKIHDDLQVLHEHARAAREAAQDVREESREIVARCLEGRIRRENEREL